MNVKRYHAPTAREALRALKADLGADAIVLSNRAVQGGVEILALPAESIGSLQQQSPPRREAPPPAKAAPASKPATPLLDEDEAFTVKLNNRRPPEPPPKVVTPFQPPRYETADYMMRKRDTMPPAPQLDDDEGVFESYNPRARAPEPEARPAQKPARKPAAPAARASNPLEFDLPFDPAIEDDSDADLFAHMDAIPRQPASRRDQSRHLDDYEPPRQPAAPPAPPVAETRRDDERIQALQDANMALMSELTGIRGMIERQLAGFAWNETQRKAPARSEVMGELLEAGFAASLARQLVDTVDENASLDEARERVRIALARDLRSMSNESDLIDRGGVYALVGPTGVGKTTTTAKIAARCVVRHGADKLAMITTDGYRIGAQEQLRIYGRILGVPVFPVRDASDLRQTLSELRDKHMVLIDTMGMSQRDQHVAEQAAMLLGAGPVRRLLLLNSTATGDTLDDVIRAFGGSELAGCILTKIDEAASLAPALGAAIMNDLELTYVTNGQRVPEDLHLPNRTYLLHRALRGAPDAAAWQMDQDEIGMMIAAAASGGRRRVAQSGGRR